MSDARPTLLIIDDNPVDREILRRDLGDAFLFIEADLAAAGLTLASSARPDGVLLDHGLPDMTGLDFLDARGPGHEDDYALIVLTGQADVDLAVELMKQGAHDLLVKGRFTPEALRRAIDNAMEKVALRRQVRAQQQALAEAHAALQVNEERLRLALDAARAGVWEWDLATERNTWSPELWALYGLVPDSLPPSYAAWCQSIHPDDRAHAEQVAGDAAAAGAEFELEWRVRDSGDPPRWLLARGRPRRDAEGRILCYVGIVLDISERKETQAALEAERAHLEARVAVRTVELRRSEAKLRNIFDLLPMGISITDPLGHLVDCNQAAETILGLTRSDQLERDFDGPEWRILRPDGSPMPAEEYASVRALTEQRAIRDVEMGIETPEGIHWILVSAVPSSHPDYGVIIVYVDISERRRIEQALRTERERLRNVIDGTRAGTWEWRVETGDVVFNERWAEMLGYRLAEFEPLSIQTWLDLAHPDDLPEAERRLAAHFAGQASYYDCEVRLRHKDGHWVWVSDRGTVVAWTPDGRPALMTGTHQDISGLKAVEAALRDSEARARAIIDASPIPKAIAHETGAVHYLNPAFVETFGYTLEDIPTWEDWRRRAVPDPAERARLRERRQAELGRVEREGGTFRPLEVSVRCKDGGTRVVMARATPLGSGDERLNTLYDITALQQARDAAEQATRAKSAFLAHMSHEIRTPMNAILGLSELALHQSLTPAARDYIEQVHGAAHQLLGILNDILDQSKLEAGRLSLDLVAFDPTALHAQLGAMLMPVAAEKGLSLRIEADPGLPEAVLGDPLRLRQVLTNLLSNALKFTARGEVRLHLSCAERIGSRARLRWRVTDTGIGMDAATLKGLFQSFSQGDVSIARRFGGTGLGLSISHQLVALMGGTLGVVSTPAVGSTFTLEVSLGVAAAQQAPAAEHAAGLSLTGTRVLVAEDQPLNQRVIGDMLRLLGAEVTFAHHGGEALERLAAAPFDAVLMDIQMPEMDGLTATRHIRANPDWAALPVIALTAGVTAEERDRMTASGMSDLLPKPVTLDAVIETLGRWVGRPADPPPRLPADAPQGALDDSWDRAGFDRARLALLAPDPDRLAERLRQFAATTRDDPAAIAAAIARGDRPAAARHVHRLKGVAVNLGARAVCDAALCLERELRGEADPGPALAALCQAHAEALSHIAALAASAAVADDAGAGDPAAARERLREIQTQLAEGLVIAPDLLSALRVALPARDRSLYLALEQHLERFDYRAARQLLESHLSTDPETRP